MLQLCTSPVVRDSWLVFQLRSPGSSRLNCATEQAEDERWRGQVHKKNHTHKRCRLFYCYESTVFKSTDRQVVGKCINQNSVTLFWYQCDKIRPWTARKRNQSWARHGKMKSFYQHIIIRWMNGQEFSAEQKLIRSHTRQAQYTTTPQVEQWVLHKTFAAEKYASHKLPHLTAHLMKHKSTSILRPKITEGQKMADIETWTPLSSPILSRNNDCV